MEDNGTRDTAMVPQDPHRAHRFVEEHVAELVWCVIAPVLLVIGPAGNCIGFCTLRGQALRDHVSSIYLQALAVVDSGALIFGLLPIWVINQFDYDVTLAHALICKLRNFLFYSCSDISVWLICGFTFDRLASVVFPFEKKVIFTRKRTCLAIVFIVILGLVKNLSVLISRDVVRNAATNVTRCRDSEGRMDHYNEYIRPWIVIVFVTAIPFVFILTSNLTLIWRVYNLHKSRIHNSQDANSQDRGRAQVATMTRVCLTVSCAFLLLNAPSIILLVGKPYWTSDGHSKALYELARTFGSLCQYTNNAINLLLYCVSGEVFRQQLKRTLRSCSRCQKSNVVGVHSGTATQEIGNL